MAVDERSQVVFLDRSRQVAVATNFVGKIHLLSTYLYFLRMISLQHTTTNAIALQSGGK